MTAPAHPARTRPTRRTVLGELALLGAVVLAAAALLLDVPVLVTELLLVAAVVDAAVGVTLLRRR